MILALLLPMNSGRPNCCESFSFVLLLYLAVHWVVAGKLMIICICHRVSERDIDNAVSEGASSLCQLNERLRVGTGCGACVEHVRECLNRCLDDDLANMGMQQA